PVHLELRVGLVFDLQQQVAAAVALAGQPDRLPGADAPGHLHVQLAAVEGDAHAVAAVDRLQRHRQLGAGIAARLRATGRARAARTGTLAREQALEEIAEAAAGAAADVAEDLVEVEAGAVEAARRRMELLAGAVAARAQLVVGRALLRVAQRLVGLAHGLELLLRVRLLAHVRVVLAGQPAVGRADLGLARAGLDPEDRVVILELHATTLLAPRRRPGLETRRPAARTPRAGILRPAVAAPRRGDRTPLPVPSARAGRRPGRGLSSPRCGAAWSPGAWGCRCAARRCGRWR